MLSRLNRAISQHRRALKYVSIALGLSPLLLFGFSLLGDQFNIWTLHPPIDHVASDDVAKDDTREFRIQVSAFDPDRREVSGTAQMAVNAACFELLKKVGNSSDECLAAPLVLRDRGIELEIAGLSPDSSDFPDLPTPTKPVAVLNRDLESTHFIIKALGNPARYPFDRYLVVAEPIQEIAYKDRGAVKGLPLPDKIAMNIDFSIPGFHVHIPNEKELMEWVYPDPVSLSGEKVKDPKRYWYQHRIYFELTRESSVKIVAIIVGIVALVSIVLVTFLTDAKELAKTVAGSLLSLWALRSILAGNSPKAGNLLDLGVIFLFFLQVGLAIIRWTSKTRPPELHV